MVRLDAQVGIGITRVRLADDHTLDDHEFLLIVVCGKRGLVLVRLREIVTERAEHHSKWESRSPTELGQSPRQDDADDNDTCRNAEH